MLPSPDEVERMSEEDTAELDVSYLRALKEESLMTPWEFFEAQRRKLYLTNDDPWDKVTVSHLEGNSNDCHR